MRRAALIGLRLAANVALVVLAAYAVSQVVHVASTDDLNFLIWLLAGAMLHDAVLLPVYTLVTSPAGSSSPRTGCGASRSSTTSGFR